MIAWRKLLLGLALLGVLFSGVVFAGSAFADEFPTRGEWGDRDVLNNGGLGYHRTLSGASWYYYTVSNNAPDEVAVPFNNAYHSQILVPTGTCKAYGGFWVLMRNEYNFSTGSLTGRPAVPVRLSDLYAPGNNAYNVYGLTNHIEYKNNGPFDDSNGGTVYATKKGDLNTVYAAFNNFKDTDANPSGITDWSGSSNLTYFCSTPNGQMGNLQVNSEFSSFSTVSLNVVAEGAEQQSYTSAPVVGGRGYLGSSFSVPYGSSVEVIFKHYLAKTTDHGLSNAGIGYDLSSIGSSSIDNSSGSINPRDFNTRIDVGGTNYYTTDPNSGTITRSTGQISITTTTTFCQTVTFKGAYYTYDYNVFLGGADKVSGACVTVKPVRSTGAAVSSCTQGGGKTFYRDGLFGGNTVTTVGISKNGVLERTSTAANRNDKTAVVFAKPGDIIQFSYGLCFGAHVVACPVGAVCEEGGYITRRDGYNNPQKNYFTIYQGNGTNEGNESFLFGRAEDLLGQEIYVNNAKFQENGSPGLSSSGSLYYNDDVDDTVDSSSYIGSSAPARSSKWQLLVASPDSRPKTVDEDDYYYDCQYYSNYGLLSDASTGGYQIPGFQNPLEDNCASSNIPRTTDGAEGAAMSSIVGATLAQTLRYKDVEAWPGSLHYGDRDSCESNSVEESASCYNRLKTAHDRDQAIYDACINDEDRDDCGEEPPAITAGGYGRFINTTYYKTAAVKVPYNFKTALSSKLITDTGDSQNNNPNNGIVYAGDLVKFEAKVDILPRTNPLTSDKLSDGTYVPYATITPPNTRVEVVELILHDGDATSDPNNATISSLLNGGQIGFHNNTLCEYYRQFGLEIVSECFSRSVKGAQTGGENNVVGNNMSNPEGETGYYDDAVTRVVPDAEAGAKYCIAVAINHGDSHGFPNGDLSGNVSDPNYGANAESLQEVLNNSSNSMVGLANDWYTSHFSCRTIAKAPNYQVWNGATYSGGSINTSVTKKVANAQLYQIYSTDVKINTVPSKTYFGSWGEYYVVSKGAVRGFASASAFGYNTTFGSMSADGIGNNIDYCDISRLTIANSTCKTNAGAIGNYVDANGIDDTGAGTLLSLITRSYTDQSAPTISDKTYSAANNNAWAYHEVNGASYLHVNGNFTIDTPIIQEGGTKVIQVDGHLSIQRNICLGESNTYCATTSYNPTEYQSTYSQNTNNLSLSNRNGTFYATNASNLPQVIIIAQSISIGSEVSQIDAWLITAKASNGSFTYDGYINTCEQFQNSTSGANTCWKTLKINGPVYTTALFLNRTGGAWAGLYGDVGNPAYETAGRYGYINKDWVDRKYFYYANPYTISANNSANRDLTCDGSITPAEIFDLSPIVTYWVFSEAQKNLQVQVPFAQELAPRY